METKDDKILINVLNQYFFAYSEGERESISAEGVFQFSKDLCEAWYKEGYGQTKICLDQEKKGIESYKPLK